MSEVDGKVQCNGSIRIATESLCTLICGYIVENSLCSGIKHDLVVNNRSETKIKK